MVRWARGERKEITHDPVDARGLADGPLHACDGRSDLQGGGGACGGEENKGQHHSWLVRGVGVERQRCRTSHVL